MGYHTSNHKHDNIFKTMCRTGSVIGLLMLGNTAIMAQTADDQSQSWESLMDMLTDDNEVSDGFDAATYDLLSDLADHPINLNTATREDLEQFPFLSANDVENLCDYLYHYAPLRSLGELSMVKGMDNVKRRLLSHFIFLGNLEQAETPSLQQLIDNGRHRLMFTARMPLYQRKGDHDAYRGYPYKHSLRYDFSSGEHLKAAFLGAQDAGEPFFANKNRCGYDFYSFFVQMSNRGKLKKLLVGKYRAAFGSGLVMGSSFLIGKSMAPNYQSRAGFGLRGHSSTLSSNYLQGVAATISVCRNTEASGLLSCRPVDGTLTDDGSVSSVVSTGYHRTDLELQKKNNTWMTVAGGHLSWHSGRWHAGATAVGQWLNRDLHPDTSVLYRRHQPVGRRFWNASIDYGYANGRLSLCGETATGDCGAWATQHTLALQLTDVVTLTALQRFYSSSYTALLASSFSDGGSIQDESGMYVGLSWKPRPQLLLSAYADIAYFAWPRYQASLASRSQDYLFSAISTHQHTSWGLRYRLKRRQYDNDDKTALVYRTTHRVRGWIEWKDGRKWSLKTQADMTNVAQDEHSMGYALCQQVGCHLANWLDVYASLAYFNTDDYNSRIYSYERGMLYSFNCPSFYGEGIRHLLLLRAHAGKRLVCQCRVATTNYFDRDTVGTGLQMVAHSSLTDIDFQLQWKI